MKNGLLTLLLAVAAVGTTNAQQTAKSTMLQQKKAYENMPVAHRFDNGLTLNAKEIAEKQAAHEDKKQFLILFIQGLDELKDKEKEKLISDVKHNPFSNRLKKFTSSYKSQLAKPETLNWVGLNK